MSRNTAYHSELQASPTELLFGETPALPGDLVGGDLPADSDLPHLLDRLRKNAGRPPAQTSIRRNPAVYYPPTTQTATHIYLKRPKAKTTPLSPRSDGPYKIVKRVGKSAVLIRTGYFKKDGTERTELHHWNNCSPITLDEDAPSAHKAPLGRKPKQSAQ